jgi:DinB family protein
VSTLMIARPKQDESDPWYHGYISKVTGENIAEQLGTQLEEIDRLLGSLSDEAAMFRYAPGKWSVKEVLGHLTDTERIFGYRLLRIVRGDPTPLPGFDENAYVPAARFDDWALDTLLEGFRAVRRSSVNLVETTRQECWSLRGVANGQPISARALAYIIVGHVSHHVGVLRERYRVGRPEAATRV